MGENTITELKAQEYIDFGDEAIPRGSMRFELKADGEATLFTFFDVWPRDAVPPKTMLPEAANGIDVVHPGGPGTPWSGVAGGWHGTVDGLESYLTGKSFPHTYEDLTRFYAGYLTDYFHWQAFASASLETAAQ